MYVGCRVVSNTARYFEVMFNCQQPTLEAMFRLHHTFLINNSSALYILTISLFVDDSLLTFHDFVPVIHLNGFDRTIGLFCSYLISRPHTILGYTNSS